MLAGLEQARQALVLAREGTGRGYGLSDGECRDAVEAAVRLVATAQSVALGLVQELDARRDAVPGAAGGSAAKTFLVHRLHVDPGVAKGYCGRRARPGCGDR